MARKQGKNPGRLVVSIRYGDAADSKKRLATVLRILMEAATKSTATSRKNMIVEEEKTSRHAPNAEGLTEAQKGQHNA